MSLISTGSRFGNLVGALCDPTLPERRIARMDPNDFHVSRRQGISEMFYGASPDPQAITTLVQNVLQFTKYKQLDLRKEFCGAEGREKYTVFRQHIDQLVHLTDGQYVLSEKKLALLESLKTSNLDDPLLPLDLQIQAVREEQPSPDLENDLIALQLTRDKIANDPLFGIHQLHRRALTEYGHAAPSHQHPAPQLKPAIQDIVISGGGAKGAVLPAAFRTLMKLAPAVLDNTEGVTGSSVGAITAAPIATGISRETLKLISGVDFQQLLGSSLFYKDGEQLKLFIRQCIRINILQNLSKLPPDVRKQFESTPQGQQLLEQLYLPLATARITFAMLARLRELDPVHFKDLTITATLKEGGQLIFDKETTPDIDIAVACRASASIPLIFEPVIIEINGELKILFDGGLIDNVAVALVERKKEHPQDHTLVMVFEEEIPEGARSVFDPQNPVDPYVPSTKDQFFIDILATRLTGLTMATPNTEYKAKVLEKIKKNYPHTISFAVDLKTTDFNKATQNPEKYARIGKVAMTRFVMQRFSGS